MLTNETIIAQATPPGRGGVGIIRISGPKTELVAQAILNKIPTVRKADYLSFLDEEQQTIDQGIAILFKAPNSFTGEDVLELQGHGGPVIMDMLMRRILKIDGIRMARPGEFSERAFLNDKMDLTQAEAIADLIDATSERAVKSAMNSLQGEFSKKINILTESLIHLRIYVEAAIDFPEEEVDFLADGKIAQALYNIMDNLAAVQKEAKQGAIIREGMKVVIAGRPNAGKSSLLNALAGKESAIVTDIAGTTRDVLREHIHIDGMPLHIIDTAGLRDSPDRVEQIGIERAWEEINNADQVLFMVDGTTTDATDPAEIWPDFIDRLPTSIGLTVIRNKMDLTGESPTVVKDQGHSIFKISAKENLGLDELKDHLKECMGYQSNTEGGFIARRRHLDAIEKADEHLQIGKMQMEVYMAGELLAEELRLAQEQLSEITGEFTSDDLLGRIFTSFCIGK
ncbi:tRNA uridine-5-carboxymethylaminomethyl(34) synthesis GTPase MnmE [Moritella sp. F3]|uniref:tRNA uridine-5-carboxymethylaminomethyl(34) synthesis GTPase MnmE n=1 Tax=Moritella sp. F3 TaxID=2718882 RepID=UPI0018E0FA54|nr:tRNA uridine-5-carboxymethylaminomethyl(34) synthesis GTPase MnmE [Moritella sp. F3]GIC78901.1 tRNA modification GTPase MnmE [Moritella sp. F1]GIC83960.1 tRNA modification GTPase MnmE [Moritella sp. F3]